MSFAPVARRPGDTAERRRSVLLVLPAVLVTVVVVGGGLGAAVLQSVGLLPVVGPATPSLDAYSAHPDDLLAAVGVSLWIAAASTLIAVVVGTAAAIVIVSGRLGGRIVGAIGAVTVTVPHLIGAATIGLLLADAGVLPRLLGISSEAWPALVGGPWWAAVIAEFAWKESAFVALVVTGTLATRVATYDETAALLGAGRWRRFRHVLLPLTAPSIVISGAISFVYALGSYEVAWLLGRTYPEPLPVLAVRLFQGVSLDSRPEAAAVAVVTSAIALLVVGLAFATLRRTAAWR
ncbi:ABC transporter permease [Microbacterium sp. SLBN-146]|uniref:ABC transporter permease n=1 Tax=Microbacterium sp. SLBN-146 TaxID=2768457 RepID=UPI00114EE50D|nr:ABC transporter permease subunit [Microbacterium sp. SLBN-146]TQJ30940.1 carbohydrate ABC transporter membrane protein 1 (CUT1 family) [Microbacterium sp. SLBN-146]